MSKSSPPRSPARTIERAKKIASHLPPPTEAGNTAAFCSVVALAFAMMPIPLVSQAGMAAHAVFQDKAQKAMFDHVWAELRRVDERLDAVESAVDGLEVVREALAASETAQQELRQLISRLVESADNGTSIEIVTDDYSSQEIVDAFIRYESVSVDTRDHSRATLRNTEVRAPRTVLRASNRSHNRLENTLFSDDDGSAVGFNNINQLGRHEVTPRSVGISKNSAIDMGGFAMVCDDDGNLKLMRRAAPTARCGGCAADIPLSQLDVRQSLRGQEARCPRCGEVGRL